MSQPWTPSEGHRRVRSGEGPPPSPSSSSNVWRAPSLSRRSVDTLASTALTQDSRRSSRIIRTFEEVPKVISLEEWYEELECGICAYILGVPHALVPCGHTFCGPCAWQWIRTGKNYTCPHCRSDVSESTPLIPNIMVEQIIERKLRGLCEGPDKEAMILERKEKETAWKVLLPNVPKPVQKRTRNIDNILPNLIEQTMASAHVRRASRHLPPLGTPVSARYLSRQGGMSLSDLRRLDVEEEALLASHSEMRRLMLLEQSAALAPLLEEPRPRLLPRPPIDTHATSSPDIREAIATNPHPGMQPRAESARSILLGRPTPHRSSILAARQGRGRGTANEPLVLHSDSE